MNILERTQQLCQEQAAQVQAPPYCTFPGCGASGAPCWYRDTSMSPELKRTVVCALHERYLGHLVAVEEQRP